MAVTTMLLALVAVAGIVAYDADDSDAADSDYAYFNGSITVDSSMSATSLFIATQNASGNSVITVPADVTYKGTVVFGYHNVVAGVNYDVPSTALTFTEGITDVTITCSSAGSVSVASNSAASAAVTVTVTAGAVTFDGVTGTITVAGQEIALKGVNGLKAEVANNTFLIGGNSITGVVTVVGSVFVAESSSFDSLSVTGTGFFTATSKITVGDMTVSDRAKVVMTGASAVASMIVTDSATVNPAENGTITVTDLFVGEPATELAGNITDAAVNVTLGVNGRATIYGTAAKAVFTNATGLAQTAMYLTGNGNYLYATQYNAGTQVSSLFLLSPDIEGYTFNGWFDARAGGNAVNSANVGDYRNIYAHFTVNTYALTLTYVEGAIYLVNGFQLAPGAYQYDYNTSLTISVIAAAGYTDDKAAVSVNGGAAAKQVSIVITGNTTVVATGVVFVPLYVVMFSDGQVVSNLKAGSTITLPATAAVEGQRFLGWYSAQTGGTLIGTSGQKYVVVAPVYGSEIHLYAKYTSIYYTVTWQNGNTVLQTGSVEYGTMPSYNGAVPVQKTEGSVVYIFAGWDPQVRVVTGNAVYQARFAVVGTVVPVTGISLNITDISLMVKDRQVLTAIIQPATATDQTLTWSVDPVGVVSVANGVITALKVGTAAVSVTAADGGFTAQCTVEVSEMIKQTESVSDADYGVGIKITKTVTTSEAVMINICEDFTNGVTRITDLKTDVAGNTLTQSVTLIRLEEKTEIVVTTASETQSDGKVVTQETVKITDRVTGTVSTATVSGENGGNQTVTTETVIEMTGADPLGLSTVKNVAVQVAVMRQEMTSVSGQGSIHQVVISVASGSEAAVDVDALNELIADGFGLTVSSPDGQIRFSEAALGTMADGGTAVSIKVAAAEVTLLSSAQQTTLGDRPAFDLSAWSVAQDFHELNGTVTVSLHYELQSNEDAAHVAVWYLNDDGRSDRMNAQYNAEDQTVTFQTDHFSIYFIGQATDDPAGGLQLMTVVLILVAALVLASIVAVAIRYQKTV